MQSDGLVEGVGVEEDSSGGVIQITVHTYQTVKLSLETWGLVDSLCRKENISLSDAIEKLIRHGAIHYEQIERQLDLQI